VAEQLLEQERTQLQQTLMQERQSIALNLLQQGIALEAIAQATGFTIAQLQELQSKG
jgi:hypothetical protein